MINFDLIWNNDDFITILGTPCGFSLLGLKMLDKSLHTKCGYRLCVITWLLLYSVAALTVLTSSHFLKLTCQDVLSLCSIYYINYSAPQYKTDVGVPFISNTFYKIYPITSIDSNASLNSVPVSFYNLCYISVSVF